MDNQNNSTNSEIFSFEVAELPVEFQEEDRLWRESKTPHPKSHEDKQGLMQQVACGFCVRDSYAWYRRLGYWEGRAALKAEMQQESDHG